MRSFRGGSSWRVVQMRQYIERSCRRRSFRVIHIVSLSLLSLSLILDPIPLCKVRELEGGIKSQQEKKHVYMRGHAVCQKKVMHAEKTELGCAYDGV